MKNYIKNNSCSNWSECNANYSFNDLFLKTPEVTGKQTRICNGELETKSCSLKIEIYALKKNICGKDYIEIYNSNTNEIKCIRKRII